MGGYAIRRGVDGVITIWMVTLLIFLLLRVTGNPIEILVPPDTLPEDRQRLMSFYGLDKPVWQQYLNFVKGAFEGTSACPSGGLTRVPSMWLCNGCRPRCNCPVRRSSFRCVGCWHWGVGGHQTRYYGRPSGTGASRCRPVDAGVLDGHLVDLSSRYISAGCRALAASAAQA